MCKLQTRHSDCDLLVCNTVLCSGEYKRFLEMIMSLTKEKVSIERMLSGYMGR